MQSSLDRAKPRHAYRVQMTGGYISEFRSKLDLESLLFVLRQEGWVRVEAHHGASDFLLNGVHCLTIHRND